MADYSDRWIGTADYNKGKTTAKMIEAIPLVGRKLNDFTVTYCDQTGNNLGSDEATCQAYRDTVAARNTKHARP